MEIFNKFKKQYYLVITLIGSYNKIFKILHLKYCIFKEKVITINNFYYSFHILLVMLLKF